MMPLNPVTSPCPPASEHDWASHHPTADSDWDLDQVLGGLYPDDRQRGAIVAELETLTLLHHSLVQRAAAPDRLACLEQRIFQLLGVA
ncbi:hypothetical protein [Trichothermofontia sp.]